MKPILCLMACPCTNCGPDENILILPRLLEEQNITISCRCFASATLFGRLIFFERT